MKKIKDAIDGKIHVDALDKKIVIQFLQEIKIIFKNEPQVIKLPKKELVFAGDTHSDYEASMKVINKFLDKQRIIVFVRGILRFANFSCNFIKAVSLVCSVAIFSNSII